MTISGIEDRVHKIFGMTKSPTSLQMGKVLQALARLLPSEAEAPMSLWLNTDEAMERLAFAAPSVAELQVAAGTRWT